MQLLHTDTRMRVIFQSDEVSAMHMARAAADGADIDYEWRRIESDDAYWMTMRAIDAPLFHVCLCAVQRALDSVLNRNAPQGIQT